MVHVHVYLDCFNELQCCLCLVSVSDSSPLIQFQFTPFQVPPLFYSNESPDSLHLCQVYQPVPRDQATDPADPVLGQSVSQWEPGAIAEGYRVSTANYHSHS